MLNESMVPRILNGERPTDVGRPAAARMVNKVEETIRLGRRTEPGVQTGSTPLTPPAMRNRLVRLAFRFMWNQEDAEDVVQDALAIAHEKAGTLRDHGKWWSWLCRIVVQRCRVRGREASRWKRHQEPYRTEVRRRIRQTLPADSSDVKASVRELLAELPPRQQEVIVLRHLQGMPYEEIARLLDIAPATARVHARAGLETLRELMLTRHPDWIDRRNTGSRD